MYGCRRFNNKKPGGPSWGSEKAPALEPGELLENLESSAMGCYWILDVLGELLKLARESFWVGGDRLRMIRLLGRNPVDAIADRQVAEVFAASHALRPVGNAFAELEADMSELAAENKETEIRARWRDLSRKGAPEKARQSLIDLVQGEIERVEAIAAEHEENAGEDAVRMRALKGFVFSPKADAMRRWFTRTRDRWSGEARCYGRRYGRGRRITIRRACLRCPGKILALMMGSRARGGGRRWGASGREESGGRGKGAGLGTDAQQVDGGTGGDLRSGGGRGQETRRNT